MIGVLGGMGPLATVDFFAKVVAATPAQDDAGHVPLLIHSDPRIPGRPAALLHGGPSPLPALMAARDRLIAAGVQGLVMACNTAHYWHGALREGCDLPFPSIVDTACEAALLRFGAGARIWLIATRATLETGLFKSALQGRGLSWVATRQSALDEWVLPAIALVKAGKTAQAGPLLAHAVSQMQTDGANGIILACTEAPMALAHASPAVQALCLDSTEVLAQATVTMWQQLQNHAHKDVRHV
jgi:aspartate racemase